MHPGCNARWVLFSFWIIALHFCLVGFFYFISQHSLCICYSEMFISGVKCFIFKLHVFWLSSSCILWDTQQKPYSNSGFAGKTKCSKQLLVRSYHFSSVRQYGRNTTEHYDSADLYKYRKAEVHTLAGVCISTALGRPDAQLQRWCITWGKRNKAVTSVSPLTAKVQMVRWRLCPWLFITGKDCWNRLMLNFRKKMGICLHTGKVLSVERSTWPLLSETLKSLIATDQHFEADRPAVRALFLETRTLLRYCWARS